MAGQINNNGQTPYAQGQGDDDEAPVQEKTELFKLLDEAIAQGLAFARQHGLPLDRIAEKGDIFKQVAEFEDYADVMMVKDEHRKAFAVHENTITGLYEACKPEVLIQEWFRDTVSKKRVEMVVEEVLNEHLPEDGYDRILFKAKCEAVFTLMLEHASHGRKWAA